VEDNFYYLKQLNLNYCFMNNISLFLVCKILICVLYLVAASVLVYDTSKTFRKNPEQLFRRRMLALSFCALSVLYFSHLVFFNLFPRLVGEENYMAVFVLLTLCIFPIQGYLLRMVSRTNTLKTKMSDRQSVSLFGCIILCYVVVGLVDRHYFCTFAARCLGGLMWLFQIAGQGYLLCKIEREIKGVKQNHLHIRVFAYVFNALGVAAFPILFLFPDSIYWHILQFMIWLSHSCLFFFIIRRDTLIVMFPAFAQPSGLLNESPHTYRVEEDGSRYAELYKRLQKYFYTEKPYLKSDINVGDVAYQLSSNKSYLSHLLNDRLKQNFNQFVNAYRIQEAQRLVCENETISLHDLCKRVGFTSMATFTVAFKLNTGMTPGEWCKKQKRFS